LYSFRFPYPRKLVKFSKRYNINLKSSKICNIIIMNFEKQTLILPCVGDRETFLDTGF